MKVISQPLQDGHIMLECTASAKEVSQAFDQAYIHFASQMGWRPEPGKSISQIALEQAGIKDLDSIVNSNLLDMLGPMAIEKRGIIPAFPGKAQPEGPLQRGSDFHFRMIILPKPTYELTSYGPVDITAKRLTPESGRVDQLINQVLTQFSKMATSEDTTPVEIGDSLRIKMETTKNGEPYRGLCFDKRTYVTGEGYMPDGFDQHMLGMEMGETRTFSFDMPSYDETGAPSTETVLCSVTVLEKVKEELPELTDEWVKRFLPGYGSVEEFTKAAQAQAEKEIGFQQDNVLQQLTMEELAKRFQGNISDEIYEAMLKQQMADLEARCKMDNKALDEFFKENGGEQQVSMMMMLQMRQNLVQNYALDSLYRHHKLSYKDADIDEVCAVMGSPDPKATRKELEAMGQSYLLKESAERLVAVKYAVEHANITWED